MWRHFKPGRRQGRRERNWASTKTVWRYACYGLGRSGALGKRFRSLFFGCTYHALYMYARDFFAVATAQVSRAIYLILLWPL